MLWQNEPTLVVGCHQNTAAEVDIQKSLSNGVHIVRRITGGGAVYHDLGNLNFSLIKTGLKAEGSNAKQVYTELSRPIIAALAQMGIKAELSGRNDITVEGKKIAGCAVHKHGDRMLLHGALLFNANLTALADYLTPNNNKFAGKAVQSVSSRVANVSDFLHGKSHIKLLKSFIISNANIMYGCTSQEISTEDIKAAEDLVKSKYATDEWNFGKVRADSFSRQAKTPAGVVEVQMVFNNENQIEQIRFFGDFFSNKDVGQLEQALSGTPYAPYAVKEKLEQLNVAQYINGLSTEELMKVMF